MVTVLIRRKVFTLGASQSVAKILQFQTVSMVGLRGYCKSLMCALDLRSVSLSSLQSVEKQISLCPYGPHYCALSKIHNSV